MRTVSIPGARLAAPRSKRLLALSGDERLVEHIRRGDELAFEVAFERHSPAILSFCRHMLGSQEEAEDAVQQAFASAFRDLQRGEREINLKPWLFAIARNRCLSMLRARRERAVVPPEIATAGLAEQVERRGELRDMLHDLDDLPEEQRAALLLSELSGLSHTEIGGVLDCEAAKVKALVFRARSGLIERRSARETPCAEIREQLANLRGGSLRRGGLRHHLRVCEGCREYREHVKRQRGMLAAVLPVTPSLGLKESVLAAIGIGGGGGGAAGGAAAGAALVAKVATVCVLAGGAGVAGERAIDGGSPDRGRATVPPAAVEVATPAPAEAPSAEGKQAPGRPVSRSAPGQGLAKGRELARKRQERKAARARSHGANGLGARESQKPEVPPGRAKKQGPAAAPPGNRSRSEEAQSRNERRKAEKPPTPAKPENAARSVPPGLSGETPAALDRLAGEERKVAKGK